MFLKNVIMTARLELVDEDINTTHNLINLKPVDVYLIYVSILILKFNTKKYNLMSVIM